MKAGVARALPDNRGLGKSVFHASLCLEEALDLRFPAQELTFE